MKNKMKALLSQNLKYLIKRSITKPIFDFYKTNYSKKALLSYITYPFKKNIKYSHTNYYEAITWAKILNDLGYRVDIIDYFTKNVKVENYDVICGFGEIFEKYIYTPNAKAKTIFYGTGMHNCWQNHITLKRLKDVDLKKGKWLGDSSRYIRNFYIAHVSWVDGVIALGNNVCVNSYKPYNDNVFQLNSPFFKIFDYVNIIKNKKLDFNKHFLWFGSKGAVHKGLDLLLDYFSKRNDIYLHICGNIQNEKNFSKIYQKELFNTSNIYYHGFVDIQSEKFKSILQQCGFIIYPSASEGGSPSVLTCVGNGGLIPIITKETTIDTGYEIWIDGFEENYIDIAVNKVFLYRKKELIDLMYKNGEIVNKKYNLNQYEKNLKKILKEIL